MEKFFVEMEAALEICIKAHRQKKKFAKQLMSGPSMPLWQVGKTAADGRPYIDLDHATYIVGIIGLNEALDYICGKELHDDDEALRLGLKVVSHLYFLVKEAGKQQGLKITIEESPAESASRRLAKIDLKKFSEAESYVRGSMRMTRCIIPILFILGRMRMWILWSVSANRRVSMGLLNLVLLFTLLWVRIVLLPVR